MDIYETSKDGKRVYSECLEVTNKYFPQYLIELKGMATGADVPFHKVHKKQKQKRLNIITIYFIISDIFIAFSYSYGRHINFKCPGY